MCDVWTVIICDDQVIYINQNNGDSAFVVSNKERRISIGIMKPKGNEKIWEPLKPSSRSLLKTIKRLVKLTNVSGKARINKTNWLSHIDILL